MGSAVTDAPPMAYEGHVGRYGRELAAGMIGVAALRRGRRALDVGCGPGALTQALAALLGPESVAAIDPSEAFVATCRERVPEADVRVGVAEALPFPDDAFDAVLAQLVVDGMDDARRGVAEMRRVGRPGGVLVACVWDFDGGMPLLNTMWAAALALDAERARSFGAGKRLPFSRADELKELWISTGLEDVSLGELVAGAGYDGIDDLWAPFEAGVGNLGKLLASLENDARTRLKGDVAARLGSPTGPFRLTARALYVRGVAPA
jgi:SAM-dependent methyltransferase